jgi:hypothetical protein
MKSVKNKLITLYSAAAWHDNLQLTVVGYNSNVLIVNNSYLTFIGYSGLDTINFTASGRTSNAGLIGGGTHFAMDNIFLSFT